VPDLISLPERAGAGNPCDAEGNAVACEQCPLPARHRRHLPRKAWRDITGDVYLMTITHGPDFPMPLKSTEVRCEKHITDWQYGPVTADEVGNG
jgi:hypothetical protein